jgi:hypothetical protein
MSNLNQRNITIITESTPLFSSDMGEIILSGATPTVTVPDPTNLNGLWFRIIYTDSGEATIETESSTLITTLNQNQSSLILCDGTSWISVNSS